MSFAEHRRRAQVNIIARRGLQGPIEILASDPIVRQGDAQSIVHPGYAEFFGEVIVGARSNEFMVRPSDWLSGH